MQQNLKTIREADGWADTQVGQQRETLSRTLQSLQADLEKIVVTINEAGASDGLKSIINGMKQLAQIISKIDTKNIDTLGSIIATYFGARVLGNAVVFLRNFSMVGLSTINVMSQVPAILRGVSSGIISTTGAIKIFATALSRLSVVFGVVMLAWTAFQAVMKHFSDETRKANDEAIKLANTQYQAIAEKVKGMQDEIGLTDAYIDKVSKLSAVINDSASSEQEKAKASKGLSEVEQQLIKIIGEEATARVKASGFTKEALEEERKAILSKKIASDFQTKALIENEIKNTQVTIEQTKARIRAMETEIRARQSLAEVRAKSARSTHQVLQRYIANGGDVNSSVGKSYVQRAELAYAESQSVQEEVYAMAQALAKVNSSYDGLLNNGINLRKALSGDFSGYVTNNSSNTKLNGMDRPEVDPNSPNGKKNKSSSGGGVNAEKFEVNALQSEYNKLIRDGKNSLNEYNNQLKEINNNEKNSGDNVTAFIEKNKLYKERKETLESESKLILDYRNKLVGLIDDEMKKNSDLVQLTGYKLDGTIQEKLENIEINKETYQHFKNLQKIVGLLNSANSELIKYDGSIEDATQKIKEQQLAMDVISVAQRNIADINQKYNMINAKDMGYFISDTEKNKLELAKNQELLEELKAQKQHYNDELIRLDEYRDTTAYQNAKENLNRISLEYKRTLGRIREIQFQEILALSKTISQSVTDNMANMLTAGQGFKKTMKNIWNDLTSYIIKRLLKVYVYEQLTGLLTRAFSPKSPTGGGVGSIGSLSGGFTSGDIFSPITSHQGSNISGYPKMHSGGAVSLGRQGVNPTLKNDEVIRTLQVGEEVNSIKDRRSNEILGMVAMKAMDSKNEQPQNIYITALDSRSFAEYMNDNADILTAVLAKQGALGR